MRDGEVDLADVWKRFRRFSEGDGRRPGLLRHAHRGEWWWVLRDITLHLDPGERLAVVGRNGSGKSTLMKIIAGFIFPYSGRVAVGGRLSAIVEMTAGAHGELTGRENVYLLGILNGRSAREMDRQFDGIMDFSGLGGVIDRPFKYYSSGMRARLAFSVVMATDPDVLIVDEALAVGDAEFKLRCEERIAGLRGQGVTLLYVSHDLGSVRALCERAVFLEGGRVVASGEPDEVAGAYEDWLTGALSTGDEREALEILTVQTVPGDRPGWTAVHISALVRSRADDAVVRLGVAARTGLVLHAEVPVKGPGTRRVECRFEALPMTSGRHTVWAGLETPAGQPLVPWRRVQFVELDGRPALPNPWGRPRPTPIAARAEITVEDR